MIRFTKILAAAVVTIMVPTMASALGIYIQDVTGPGASGVLQPGETVTFDLVMENVSGIPLFAAGVIVDGYDSPDISGVYDTGLRLDGGQVAAAAFGTNIPTFGIVGSLNNTLPAPREVWFVNNLQPRAWETRLLQAVALDGSTGTGQDDLGIGGAPISSGDVHFRVTFINTPNPGDINNDLVTLNFNFEGIGNGGVVLETPGDSFSLTVIPEPGSALLMGLGLAGLATSRRR